VFFKKFSVLEVAWDVFRCCNQELPPLAAAADRYEAVILTGSHYSAYEDLPWIVKEAEWLAQCVAQQPNLKVVGLCFGAQASPTHADARSI
jgi:GMP synthase-like glutamine amidotransferase